MRRDYTDFNAADFLQDDYFLAWLKGKDPDIDLFWEQWQKDHPEKAAAISEAKELYHLLLSFNSLAPSSADQEDVWHNIEQQIEVPSRKRIGTVFRSRIFQWSCAAALILLFAGGWLEYIWISRPEKSLVVERAGDAKRKIILEDGSVIVLNAHTTLKYYIGNYRELWINGEAFFDIKHKQAAENARKPFTVHAGVEDIAVLGTSFVVKTQTDGIRVVLIEGKVKASVGNHSIILRPGEKVEWSSKGFSKEHVNAQLYEAWKDGEFEFDHTSIEELAELLKAVYGYELVIKNRSLLHTQNISGSISAENEETLWKAFSLLFDAKVQKQGQKVVLTPNN